MYTETYKCPPGRDLGDWIDALLEECTEEGLLVDPGEEGGIEVHAKDAAALVRLRDRLRAAPRVAHEPRSWTSW